MSGNFMDFGFIYENGCAAIPATGQPSVVANRWTISNGETLQATFCNEGSPIIVTVANPGIQMFSWICVRTHGNANMCQRYL